MFVARQQKHLFWAKWSLCDCPRTPIFFREKNNRNSDFLYFTKCETAWHGGWPFNRARNCRNSKKCFRDYDKFCDSCAFWMGVFVEFLMKICFSCYTISATLYFSKSFFSLNLFFVRESFRKHLWWAWVVQNTIVGCFSFLHPRKK